jgi:hypothetical protein
VTRLVPPNRRHSPPGSGPTPQQQRQPAGNVTK